ncbi:MAG: glycosyltransferase [Pirellulaceae bacterium]|jgi:cellulose synthase/poly-beta-1,6-N-acetylglucosamine synthase-like glycosyltransferase|nr:glycosyltransferase [Pirellulaceae bacterium]
MLIDRYVSCGQPMFWTLLAAANLIFVLGVVVLVRRGTRRIPRLADIAESDPTGEPRVSVIVAARNEARNIRVALQSLLALDYGAIELIVVNDRSTDTTGSILEELAHQDARLKVCQVEALPPGWLGKNHALHVGAGRASGDYLLFTDADVIMDRTALRRAMAYVQATGADHLAISPQPLMPTLLLQAFVVLFIDLFSVYLRPWSASNPRSRAFVGIGAFNLIRREVYEAVGGHQLIAMRPDDDVKLGKLIKQRGFRQHLLAGQPMVRVPWYASLGELIEGLEKNSFAGVDYRVSTVLGGTLVLFAFDLFPFLGVVILGGPPRWLYAATALVLLVQARHTARDMGLVPRCAWLFPVAVLLFIYIQWRAMLLAYVRNGIRWRGTHYALDELRANKV